MPLVMHAADLHISQSEQKYCFSVLQDLIKQVVSHKAELLLLSGDTFNSPEDVNVLWDEFESRLLPLKGRCAIFMIPGNHDPELPGSSFIQVVSEPAFTMQKSMELVLLPWPHSDARELELPLKKGLRICMAHGTMPELGLPDADYLLDTESLINQIQADYYCLGHIHASDTYAVAGARFLYPGSGRVWRKKEYGPRNAFLIDTSRQGYTGCVSRVPLNAAGEYRDIEIVLGDLKGLEYDIIEQKGSWNANDYIQLHVSGLGSHRPDSHELARQIARIKPFRKIAFNFTSYFTKDSLPVPAVAEAFIARVMNIEVDAEYRRQVLLNGLQALGAASAELSSRGDVE